MTNGNDSAYAFGAMSADGMDSMMSEGLTKREYFAAIALSVVAGAFNIHSEKMQMAEKAVEYADALIAALNHK